MLVISFKHEIETANQSVVLYIGILVLQRLKEDYKLKASLGTLV